jgi:DNA-binding protein H-NS
MTTYRDLTAQIAKLQAEAEKLRGAEKAGVIGRIREAIDLYGLSAEDLGFSRSAKGAAPRSAVGTAKAAKATAPQFGVPKRAPFLISSAPTGGGADVVNNGKRSRKVAAAKNVGVAKYRDPASGKTWTGRGKPPLWIAGVEDREPFLIK